MNTSDTVNHRVPAVVTIAALGAAPLRQLLAPLGLTLAMVADDEAIPGSFWGDAEAGLRGSTLYVRGDTPVHSALHEAGHFVCMDPARRHDLDTNAGGDYAEENAVCYWQIMVCDQLAGMDRATMCADMDAWGYTFRLGSAAAWFAEDAEDARDWLAAAGLLDTASGRLRLAVRG